jgi:hypothetical protein
MADIIEPSSVRQWIGVFFLDEAQAVDAALADEQNRKTNLPALCAPEPTGNVNYAILERAT